MEGKSLSHFRILSQIGQGGMGVVYKGEDVKLGRTVAIKVLPPDLVRDEARRARFVTEARTAAAVTHPNIATIHEIDEADGTTFIAMEYLEGETLRERLAKKSLTIKSAVQLAAEIAEGLAAAHNANIIHRDLKPDNVMVTRDGHAKILDFGLARLLEPAEHIDDPNAATQALTNPGQVIGTPAYMSPEQARGLELDFRSDIFSFGCTLYEMVTGQRPFQGATSTDVLSDILHKEPIAATTLNPDLPASVHWILAKCLDKEASGRYQSTRDLVVDMRHLQRECQTITSTPSSITSQENITTLATPSASSPQVTPGGFTGTLTRSSLGTGSTLHTDGGPPVHTGPRRGHLLGFVAGILIVAAAVLGALGFFGRGNHVEYMPEENSVAIFAFENLKDPQDPERLGQIFQDVLITALSDLDPLKVYSGQRLYELQKQLSTNNTNAFDREFTTDVARSAGAQHMVTGSLGKLGNKWILNCQMVQVADGTVAFSKRIDGEDLYEIADILTHQLRQDLRVAAPTEVAQSTSVRNKTSSSLDAYRIYLDGVDLLNTNKYQEAAQTFQKAIDIDPDFGKAYYKLALALSWPGDNLKAAKATYDEFLNRKMYSSDKEKRVAQVARARLDNQYSEILPEQQALVRDYPDEKDVWYELGETLFHYPGGGREEEALVAFDKATALDPDFLLPYQHIFDALWRKRRFDEALTRADALIEHDPDNPTWHRFRAATRVFTVDRDKIDAVVQEALEHQKTPEDRRILYDEVASNVAFIAPGKTEEYLQKALAADPDHDDPQIISGLMQLLSNRLRWDEFEKWVLTELEKSPDNTQMQERLRVVYANTRQYDKLINYTRELVRDNPEDLRWALGLAANAILNDDPEATRDIDNATRLARTTDDKRRLYATLASAYSNLGNHNVGLEYIRRGLEVEADKPYASLFGQLGWEQYSRGRYEEAESAFESALELNPNDVNQHYGLAKVAQARGESEESVRRVERLMETLPPGPFKQIAHALRLLHEGQVGEANAILDEYLAIPSPDWQQWNKLTQTGEMYLQFEIFDKAADLFQQATALDLNKRSPTALLGLGRTAMQQGNNALAESFMRRAVGVQYPTREARVGLATALLLQEKFAEAEDVLQTESHIRPHRSIDELLVLVHMGQGQPRQALDLAQRCVAMDSSRVSHELLAWTLVAGNLDVKRGDREAQVALELPLRNDDQFHQLPCFPPAEHTLGLAALKLADPQQALEHLRRAAEICPERKSLQEDLRRVQDLVSGTP